MQEDKNGCEHGTWLSAWLCGGWGVRLPLSLFICQCQLSLFIVIFHFYCWLSPLTLECHLSLFSFTFTFHLITPQCQDKNGCEHRTWLSAWLSGRWGAHWSGYFNVNFHFLMSFQSDDFSISLLTLQFQDTKLLQAWNLICYLFVWWLGNTPVRLLLSEVIFYFFILTCQGSPFLKQIFTCTFSFFNVNFHFSFSFVKAPPL